MDGQRTMWTGYGRSVNTYFVWLEQQIGPEYAVAMAERLGIRFNAAHDRELADNGADSWGPFTLGVVATTPLELVNAYATVAAGGIYCKPLPVSSIKTAERAVTVGGDATVQAGGQQGRRGGRRRRGPLPGAEQVLLRPVQRRHGPGGAADPRQPAARRQDRQLGEERHRDVRRVHARRSRRAALPATRSTPRDLVGSSVSHDVDVAVLNTMKMALKGMPYVELPPAQRRR